VGYQSIFKDKLFAGQTVVITGGASGIGRCTAHELAVLGADVAIVGRNLDKLEAVQAEIRSDGGRVSIHTADIRDEATISDVVDAILTEHGRTTGCSTTLAANTGHPWKPLAPRVLTL
jgi:citronellol/citronellal dehydrogenase